MSLGSKSMIRDLLLSSGVVVVGPRWASFDRLVPVAAPDVCSAGGSDIRFRGGSRIYEAPATHHSRGSTPTFRTASPSTGDENHTPRSRPFGPRNSGSVENLAGSGEMMGLSPRASPIENRCSPGDPPSSTLLAPVVYLSSCGGQGVPGSW